MGRMRPALFRLIGMRVLLHCATRLGNHPGGGRLHHALALRIDRRDPTVASGGLSVDIQAATILGMKLHWLIF